MQNALEMLNNTIEHIITDTYHLSGKELGIALSDYHSSYSGMIFAYRNGKIGSIYDNLCSLPLNSFEKLIMPFIYKQLGN